MNTSLFWFDFETFGANPVKDKPSQFAAIRTTLDFTIIDEPINIYCRPSNDFIPHPEACLITGITPQTALKKGVSEAEFFKIIHSALQQPKTCAIGYNNIRFDDEVIRHGLYRNFYDPYSREWKNGNSRWDLIDLLRMTHALRPKGIQWPKNDEGYASFKLEALCQANAIEHNQAHDALFDVYATIEMAKRVKNKQPQLFDYLFSMRDKRKVAEVVSLYRPFIHSSGMLNREHHYTGVMLPLLNHPVNKNSMICYDLTQPIEAIFTLSAKEIQQCLFTKKEDLPTHMTRLPIKEVLFNKCPAVAPLSVLTAACQERLKNNLSECLAFAEHLKEHQTTLCSTIKAAYSKQTLNKNDDPEHALYSGGFFNFSDKQQMEQIKKESISLLGDQTFHFNDPRLSPLLFRYRARNAYSSLSNIEKQQWLEYRRSILLSDKGHFTLKDYKKIRKTMHLCNLNEQKIMADLDDYVQCLFNEIQ
jgi:exodeoxyribonuclease-1